MVQTVKNLCAMQETLVQSLGWEDALEKEMVTHSSILAWKILWTEEPICRSTVRTRHGTINWFQIRKGIHQGCIMSPDYLT